MNESILNGLFALSGTLLGGIISYILNKDKKETKKLRSQINLLSKQVISYWNLEKLYSDEIGILLSKSSRTILQEYREKIVSMALERPSMTANEAKKIIDKNS